MVFSDDEYSLRVGAQHVPNPDREIRSGDAKPVPTALLAPQRSDVDRVRPVRAMSFDEMHYVVAVKTTPPGVAVERGQDRICVQKVEPQ